MELKDLMSVYIFVNGIVILVVGYGIFWILVIVVW